MIREGKEAEFIYCKQGKTLAPVAGCTKSPFIGDVRNGGEYAKAVKAAIVIMAEPEEHEKPARVQLIPAGQSSVRKADIQRASVVTPSQNGASAQRIVCKNINCSNARNDITIKNLFHIEQK